MQNTKYTLLACLVLSLSGCAVDSSSDYQLQDNSGPESIGQLSMLPPGSLASKLAFNESDVEGAVKIKRRKTRILRTTEGDTMMMVYYPIKVSYPSVASGIYNSGMSITHRDHSARTYTVIDTREASPISQDSRVFEIALEPSKKKTKITVEQLHGKKYTRNELTKLLRDIRRGMGHAVASSESWHLPTNMATS